MAAAAALLFTIFIPMPDGFSMYGVVVLLALACAAMCLKLFEKRPAMRVYIYMGCGFLWLKAAYEILSVLL